MIVYEKITDFDNCYLKILDYFKNSDKTIVIDSAQYRNIKDYSILKGKLIVMRTSINTCYERVLFRCPECGSINTITSSGNKFSCSSCKETWEYNSNLTITKNQELYK